jgi:hypothetical protein
MIQNYIRHTSKLLNKKTGPILTGLSIFGVVTTAYLTATASFKAARVIDQEGSTSEDKTTKLKENANLIWKFYIPPITTCAVTIGAIAYGSKLGAQRTAAAISAYTVTERAFSEYRTKVVEEIGKHKEQIIKDDIARDVVSNKSPDMVILAGRGEVMCCELYTRRYFMSDMETLRKAQNDINSKVMNELYVTLDEFYDLINLPNTALSSELGWDSDQLMELNFSTVLSEDGRPCLAFNYNYVKPI